MGIDTIKIVKDITPEAVEKPQVFVEEITNISSIHFTIEEIDAKIAQLNIKIAELKAKKETALALEK